MTFEESLIELGAMQPGDRRKINGHRIERNVRGLFDFVDLYERRALNDYHLRWGQGITKASMAAWLADEPAQRWEVESELRKELFFRDSSRRSWLMGGKRKRRKRKTLRTEVRHWAERNERKTINRIERHRTRQELKP